MISHFIKQESLEKKLVCSKDIVDAIVKQQQISNDYRAYLNLTRDKSHKPLNSLIITKAFVFNVNSTQSQNMREIQGMKNYYNFFTVDLGSKFEFRSAVLSDSLLSYPIEYTDKKIKQKKEQVKAEFEKEVFKIQPNVFNLSRRVQNIKILMREGKVTISSDDSSDDTEEVENIEIDNVYNSSFCKKKCKGCKIKCKYKIRELNENNELLTARDIIIELAKHKHAKSRRINGIGRTAKESKKELRTHYRENHLI